MTFVLPVTFFLLAKQCNLLEKKFNSLALNTIRWHEKQLDFVSQYNNNDRAMIYYSNNNYWPSVCTWLKLSSALCRLACIPVGGSFVILMEFSKIPCGIMWPSGVEEGSALTNTLKFWWLASACCSSRFSRVPSQLATKWIFCSRYKKQRVQS